MSFWATCTVYKRPCCNIWCAFQHYFVFSLIDLCLFDFYVGPKFVALVQGVCSDRTSRATEPAGLPKRTFLRSTWTCLEFGIRFSQRHCPACVGIMKFLFNGCFQKRWLWKSSMCALTCTRHIIFDLSWGLGTNCYRQAFLYYFMYPKSSVRFM